MPWFGYNTWCRKINGIWYFVSINSREIYVYQTNGLSDKQMVCEQTNGLSEQTNGLSEQTNGLSEQTNGLLKQTLHLSYDLIT